MLFSAVVAILVLCANEVHGGKHDPDSLGSEHVNTYPVNCENVQSVLKLLEGKPFAHGHSKEVYHARFVDDFADRLLAGSGVVLKKPTQPTKNDLHSFTKEVAKIEALRGHPGIVDLHGYCLQLDYLFSVSENLTTWWEFHHEGLPWCVRIHTSITILSLFSYLQQDYNVDDRPNAKGWLHCDLNRGQFAFSDNYEAKLIDFGGLEFYTSFPAHNKDTSCTEHHLDECSSCLVC